MRMPDTRSAAWREFDRRVYWATLIDWLVVAACALVVVAVVSSTQLRLHDVPTPTYHQAVTR